MAQVAEDAALRRILAVSLSRDHAVSSGDPPVVFLEGLAQELAAGSDGGAGPPLLARDSLDLVFVNRLIESPPEHYPQAPFQYLLGCFARASAELRGAAAARPGGDAAAQQQQQLQGAVLACRELVVSYAGLVLAGTGVVPEPDAAAQRGALQLLDSIDARDGAQPAGAAATPLPPGFLEELAARQDADTLGQIMAPIVRELARRVQACSPLGPYSAPLAVVRHLASIEPMARALVALPSFLPDLAASSGRAIELPGMSWLGPCFSPSAVEDEVRPPATPRVADCFTGLATGTLRGPQAEANKHSLQLASKHIAGELAGVVKSLLGKGTREDMLRWLGATIEGNNERGKMQPDMRVAASHGFFCNLDAVLLRLCGPFLSPGPDSPFWRRADPTYVTLGTRLSFKEDTKLAATQQEAGPLLQQQQEQRAAAQAQPPGEADSGGGGGYHFICECFFMTLKALHLGLMRLVDAVSDGPLYWSLMQLRERQAELEDGMQRMAGSPHEVLMRNELALVQRKLDVLMSASLQYDTVLGDPELAADCLALYRLLAAWLLRLVSPSGQPELPLPQQVPASWALLPEWFIEDLADFLIFTTRAHPRVLAGQQLGDLMLFMVVFMGSPQYLRNPFLRSKLSQVVHHWLPREREAPGFTRGRRPPAMDQNLAYLFEAHPGVLANLVPSLLSLYADVEHTDRANQFYAKFTMRQYIGDVLMYCWSVPAHREAWARFAALEGGRGQYLRFANMLINDATYLLDEALKKVQEFRELESQLSGGAPHLSPQEAQERRTALSDTAGRMGSLFQLASGVITTISTSTSEVPGPFLLPEMVERLAAMLNYFLLYLTGPQRRALKLKDPERYHFKPKELLAQICTVYLHMAAADRGGAWAAAVAADRRSYRPEMFAEASMVLRQFGLLPPAQIDRLELLAGQVAQAAASEQAEEEVLGDVPDEFLDPIQYTLMKDPVLLPTSNSVMDRATIARHLLSDPRDPINRQPLTAEMLQPQAELKARIDEWLREQREARRMRE